MFDNTSSAVLESPSCVRRVPMPKETLPPDPAEVRPPFLEQVVAVLVLALPVAGTIAGIVLLCTYGISWTSAILFLVGYFLTINGIGIGYHRLASHNSFKTHRLIRA